MTLNGQKRTYWMTLNGQKRTLTEKKSFYGAHQKKLNENGTILSAAKCRSI